MSKPVVVLSTCADTDTAQKIASALVEQHLAACVSVVDRAHSTYRWQGKLNVDAEVLLIIKTMSEHLDAAKAVVKQLSGYEVPEFIAIEIIGGSAEYLDWLKAECGTRLNNTDAG
ncbi:MAG: divalent-cation tolerance protein CutA [candidate division Zixibacteria bacterium]|nr:divalent-cation tolerance protein CutA [candidate division Zixibacteria bacterium]